MILGMWRIVMCMSMLMVTPYTFSMMEDASAGKKWTADEECGIDDQVKFSYKLIRREKDVKASECEGWADAEQKSIRRLKEKLQANDVPDAVKQQIFSDFAIDKSKMRVIVLQNDQHECRLYRSEMYDFLALVIGKNVSLEKIPYHAYLKLAQQKPKKSFEGLSSEELMPVFSKRTKCCGKMACCCFGIFSCLVPGASLYTMAANCFSGCYLGTIVSLFRLWEKDAPNLQFRKAVQFATEKMIQHKNYAALVTVFAKNIHKPHDLGGTEIQEAVAILQTLRKHGNNIKDLPLPKNNEANLQEAFNEAAEELVRIQKANRDSWCARAYEAL